MATVRRTSCSIQRLRYRSALASPHAFVERLLSKLRFDIPRISTQRLLTAILDTLVEIYS